MSILWPVVGVGTVMIATGTCIIIFRAPLIRFIVDTQQQVFGQATRRIQGAATAKGLVAPGIAFIFIGLVAIVMAVLAPESF